MEKEKLVIERNCTSYYLPNFREVPGNDLHIITHLNGLIILGLSKDHFLLNDVDLIKFVYDKAPTKVTARKKVGSVNLKPKKRFCSIYHYDQSKKEQRFDLTSPFKGLLMDTNSHFGQKLDLLKNKPETDGFLAVIDPRGSDDANDEVMKLLISEEEYQKVVSARKIPVQTKMDQQ